MTSARLVDLVASLAERDPGCEDRDGVGAILRDLNRLTGWVDARKLACTRQLRRLEAEGRCETVGSALIDESRHSAAEANRTLERERVCNLLPGLEDRLATGAVSADHLDVLARLTKNLSDRDLSDLQARGDEVLATTGGWVSECERKAKQLIDGIRTANRPDHAADELNRQREQSHVKRWTDKISGLRMTLLGLDPIRDTTIHNVIDAHLARLRTDPGNDQTPFPALHAQAVVNAITDTSTGNTTSDGEGGGSCVSVPEIVIHTDLQTLAHGPHPDTLCETIDGVPVAPAALQRSACDAVLQAVVVNPDGTFDELCAEQRLASRQQRRALAAMYATCAHPHCTVPFSRCRIHHLIPWQHGGRTVLANLIPVCEHHHHQIHEGGWTLTMTPDRTTTWTRPDNTVWWTGNSTNRQSTNPAPSNPPPDPPPDRPPDAPPNHPPDPPCRPSGGPKPADPRSITWLQPTLC
jgi:hypothetical protein